MAVINRLSPHLANLIAAGEVVERPASAVKELVENAVDAGATKVVVELRDGGMTFLRVTDNGCGMSPEDAATAFLRHATSKIRTEEDLEAIGTMGFRGEALAAIASVSRIDLLTKERGAVAGTALHLEAGVVTEESEAGCPEGTTIIVRDLFYNTPARMKFMKQDSVEGGAVAGAVQRQALAHPEVAIRLIRDGKEILSTTGDGKLLSAMAGIYGKEAGSFVPVDSTWEKNKVWGYVSKPTQARASRTYQIFFVNGRPVKSRILQAGLEEAYRNQMMVGKFPACVLHLELPNHKVDVNVHPAKTEVKFLAEREAFDCIHYGVLAALNKTQDRPELRFAKVQQEPVAPHRPEPEKTFRTMNVQEFKTFAKVVEQTPQADPVKARKTMDAMEKSPAFQVESPKVVPERIVPEPVIHITLPEIKPEEKPASVELPGKPEEKPEEKPTAPVQSEKELIKQVSEKPMEEPEQTVLPMPEPEPYTVLGELFNTYIVVEQSGEAFLIDKHAAHERILFEKLRSQKREVPSQELLVSQVCRLGAEAAAVVLQNTELLDELGYGVEEFGEGTLVLRRVPMDLDPQQGADSIEQLSQDLLAGRREDRDTVRDNLLHTIACKAAIKAGWHTDPLEREALVKAVLSREELKYCPHGRPICIKITKQQLERQFGRS